MDSSEIQTVGGSGKRFSSEPVGWLLSRFGLIVTLAFLVIAAWYGQVTIAILLGLVLAAGGVSKFWSRFSLVGVSCQRTISQQRVFPGESVELKLKVLNRKLLPLPWIQIDDEMPLGFTPDISPAPEKPGVGFLSKSASLLWYTGASWRHQLQCNKRGYYKLGPITITSGDIFGFYPRSTIEPLIDHIIVYPKIFPITQLGIPSVYPLGETRAERRIFEDPTRAIGVRDYNPYDSLRRIHWKASARHQKLQSKVYEPTTTLKVVLFLAVDSFQHHLERGQEDFELGISVAASIVNCLTEQDSQVGLFVNTRQADSGQPVMIPPGSSFSHLVAMLEALAKTTPKVIKSFDDFLQEERSGLPWGTTLVFILSQTSKLLTEIFASLRESGYKLLVIQIGDEEASKADGIVWHNVKHSTDLVTIGAKETR